MPGPLTALVNAATSLAVFEQSLATAQNNVANALTPGYARQRLLPQALPFEPSAGLPGGIRSGVLESARDRYAELAVRRELNAWARADQLAAGLSRIEPLFDATGQAGIPAALTRLFQSFSALSVAPNDDGARSLVISRAEDVAGRFRDTATALHTAVLQADEELRAAVTAINRIGAGIRDWNASVQGDFRAGLDPSRDAALHAALEELAEYVNFTAIRSESGSVTVLLDGGQAPLVIGDRAYALEVEVSAADAVVRDSAGRDVTEQISAGRLRGLIELKNTILPSLIADLDRLAESFAARVNALLASGVDAAGEPGRPLFTWDPAAGAAGSLAVAPITPSQIAAAAAGAPYGNGIALELAGLASSAEIDGLSFTAFYGALAGRMGRELSGARESAEARNDTLLQARALRDQASAVSLDEEAIRMIEFQRAYEAAAKLITVLDELTATIIGMLKR